MPQFHFEGMLHLEERGQMAKMKACKYLWRERTALPSLVPSIVSFLFADEIAAGPNLLNPPLVLNDPVQYEVGIVNCRVRCYRGVEGVSSDNAAINETRKSQMSGTKLKSLYIRVPQIVASLVIALWAYAQRSPDKPMMSLPSVPRLHGSQASICRPQTAQVAV